MGWATDQDIEALVGNKPTSGVTAPVIKRTATKAKKKPASHSWLEGALSAIGKAGPTGGYGMNPPDFTPDIKPEDIPANAPDRPGAVGWLKDLFAMGARAPLAAGETLLRQYRFGIPRGNIPTPVIGLGDPMAVSAAEADPTLMINQLKRWQTDSAIAKSKQAYRGARGDVIGGLESAAQSILVGLPGAVVGSGAGPGGAILGFATSGGTTFGMSEVDRFLEQAAEQGIPREKALGPALLSGLSEGGTEFLSDLIGGEAVAGKPLARAGLRGIAERALMSYPRTASSEIGSEMLNAAIQSKANEWAGLPTDTPWNEALKVIGPTAVASAVFSGAGAYAATKIHPKPKTALEAILQVDSVQIPGAPAPVEVTPQERTPEELGIRQTLWAAHQNGQTEINGVPDQALVSSKMLSDAGLIETEDDFNQWMDYYTPTGGESNAIWEAIARFNTDRQRAAMPSELSEEAIGRFREAAKRLDTKITDEQLEHTIEHVAKPFARYASQAHGISPDDFLNAIIGVRGEMPTDTEDMLLKQGQDNAPTFYSQLQSVVEDKMPNRQRTTELAAMLLKNGVKPEEIAWTHLSNFLAQDRMVTKKEVLDHILENQIKVEEVVLGEPQDMSELPEIARNRIEEIEKSELPQILNDMRSGKISFEEWKEQWNKLTDEQKSLGMDKSRDTIYGDDRMDGVTLPGGKAYRELLITLPTRYTKGKEYHSRHWMKDREDEDDSWGGEPIAVNPILHVRFDSRKINGQKTLFIQEIQSDWHQDARYYRNRRVEELAKSEGITIEEAKKLVSPDVGYYDPSKPYVIFNLTTGQEITNVATKEEAITYTQEHPDTGWASVGANWISDEDKQVLNVPFKKTWPELAMKRMLRWAAENGYDQVAWTTGEMQNARSLRAPDDKGHVDFYDKIMPNFVNKYLKKYGVKVGTNYLGSDPIHSVPITDQMREDFTKVGQPLFQYADVKDKTFKQVKEMVLQRLRPWAEHTWEDDEENPFAEEVINAVADAQDFWDLKEIGEEYGEDFPISKFGPLMKHLLNTRGLIASPIQQARAQAMDILAHKYGTAKRPKGHTSIPIGAPFYYLGTLRAWIRAAQDPKLIEKYLKMAGIPEEQARIEVLPQDEHPRFVKGFREVAKQYLERQGYKFKREDLAKWNEAESVDKLAKILEGYDFSIHDIERLKTLITPTGRIKSKREQALALALHEVEAAEFEDRVQTPRHHDSLNDKRFLKEAQTLRSVLQRYDQVAGYYQEPMGKEGIESYIANPAAENVSTAVKVVKALAGIYGTSKDRSKLIARLDRANSISDVYNAAVEYGIHQNEIEQVLDEEGKLINPVNQLYAQMALELSARLKPSEFKEQYKGTSFEHSKYWNDPEYLRNMIEQKIEEFRAQSQVKQRITDLDKAIAYIKTGAGGKAVGWLAERVKHRVITPEMLESFDIQYQHGELPGFFSQLDKVIEAKMPARQKTGALQSMLLSNGVKPQEIYWTGLNEFLADDRVVTKQEVQDYLKNNKIELRETVRGINHKTKRRLEELRLRSEILGKLSPEEEDEVKRINQQLMQTPRFKQYTTAGSDQNYQELLIQVNPGTRVGRYQSSHWPGNLNVLVHVRFDDRQAFDGGKILYIEEIQSDWHQDARKARNAEIDRLVSNGMSREEAKKTVPEDFGYGYDRSKGKVEPAPFQKTWSDLAFKRMLHWAISNGYEGISWATGEQNLRRYPGLREEGVSSIKYSEDTEEGTSYLEFFDDQGSSIRFEELEGNADLQDKIGDEYTKQLLAQNPDRDEDGIKTYELKFDKPTDIGGEGMKGYYDDILPKTVQKYVKKWGLNLEETELEDEHRMHWQKSDDPRNDGMLWTVPGTKTKIESFSPGQYHIYNGKRLVAVAARLDYAQEMVEEMIAAGELDRPNLGGPQKVVWFNDKIKESVLGEGQPLFQEEKRGATQFLKDSKALMYLFENANVSTLIHEIVHVFQRYGATEEDNKALEAWAGVKNGVWTNENYEKVAYGVERYLWDGRAPTKELKGPFAKFKKWLKEIYTGLKGTRLAGVVIKPETEEVFNRWFKGEPIKPRTIQPSSNVGNEARAKTVGKTLEKPEKKGFAKTVEEAQQHMDEVDEYVGKAEAGQALNDVEQTVVQAHYNNLESQVESLWRSAEAALDQEDEEGYQKFMNQADGVLAKMDPLVGALVKTGTTLGRAMSARRIALNDRWGYSVIVRRAEKAKGGVIGKEDRKTAKEWAQKVKDAEDVVKQLTAQVEAKDQEISELQKLVENRKNGEARKKPKNTDEALKKIDAELARIKRDVKDIVSNPNDITGLSHQASLIAYRLASALLRRAALTGPVDNQKLFSDMRAAFPQVLSDRQVWEALAGPKRQKSKLTLQEAMAKARRDRLKAEANAWVESFAPTSTATKLKNNLISAMGVAHALQASGDWSAVLRQGFRLSLRHPWMATKAFGNMVAATFSEAQYQKVKYDILEHPEYGLANESGLFLSDVDGRLNAKEEGFVSNLLRMIPHVKMSERAYTTFLNKMRFDTFRYMTGRIGLNKITPEQAKALASYINVATGRSNLLKTTGPMMTTIFRAPQYVLSQFELPLTLLHGDMKAKQLIAEEIAAWFGLTTTIVALAAMGGADTDKDPKSPDFGQIIIDGHRIDPWAGLRPVAVALAQWYSGEYSRDSETRKRPQEYTVGRFVRQKLAPLMGLAWDWAAGSDYAGKPFDAKNELFKLATPLVWNDTYEAVTRESPTFTKKDIDTFVKGDLKKGAGLGVLSFLGAGITTYDKPTPKTPSPGFIPAAKP